MHRHPLDGKVYPSKSFDKLNHIKLGQNTEDIKNLVSESVIRCGLRVYRIMRQIDKVITPIKPQQWTALSEILERPIPDLRELFFEDSKMTRRLKYSEKTITPRPRHRPFDAALYILVNYLRMHMLKNKGKPHNELIADFLNEQRIDKTLFGPDRISRLARIDISSFRSIYEFYREVYAAPSLKDAKSFEDILAFINETDRIAVDRPSDRIYDLAFPPFDDFFPL